MAKKPKSTTEIQADSHVVVAAARIRAANDSLAVAKAEVKAEIKRAEGYGLNAAALKEAMDIRKSSTRDATIAHWRKTLEYLFCWGDGVTKDQLDLFTTIDERLPLDDKAFQDGLIAGMEGFSTSQNPHDLGSPAGQQWMSGWHNGLEQRDLIMALKPKAELIKGAPEDDGEEAFPDAAVEKALSEAEPAHAMH